MLGFFLKVLDYTESQKAEYLGEGHVYLTCVLQEGADTMKLTKIAAGILMAATLTASSLALAADRPRDMGIEIGVLHPGANNAITDVKGVLVGQVTLVDEKKGMHTGVTAIVPHTDNIFKNKVPAGVFLAFRQDDRLSASSGIRQYRNAYRSYQHA